MKYTLKDGTVCRSKKDYWLTMYPMRENETTQVYIKRIKKKLDVEYLEKTNRTSREYMKNRYHTDEKHRKYQIANALHHYHHCRQSMIDVTNINK